tara:strand:- start:43 stop:249 length:207 start_codon:yes stop_codon:yes gene_type:complete
MTYEELLEYLNGLQAAGDIRLQDTITVWDVEHGEYYPAQLLEFAGEDDILDSGHLFIGYNLGDCDWDD